jgi:hypothetical protein
MRPLALMIAAFLLLPAIAFCRDVERFSSRPENDSEPRGSHPSADERATLSNMPQVAKSLHRVIVRYSKGSRPLNGYRLELDQVRV